MSRLNRTIGVDPLPGLGFRSTLPKKLDVLPGIGASFKIEYAPGYEPLSTIPESAWIDVTSSAMEIRTLRGSAQPFGPMPPGQAVIRLDIQDNPDTDLFHTSTSSNQAKVGHPVRVSADLPDGIVRIWTGYILAAQTYYARPYSAEVTWNCQDITGWLSRDELEDYSAPANNISVTIAGILQTAGVPANRIDLDIVDRQHLTISEHSGRTMTLIEELLATAGPNAYIASTPAGKIGLHNNTRLANNTVSELIIGPPETTDTIPSIEWTRLTTGVSSKDLANIVHVESSVSVTIETPVVITSIAEAENNPELLGRVEQVTYQAATQTVRDDDSVDAHGPARRTHRGRYRPQDESLMLADGNTILRGFKDSTPVVSAVKLTPTKLGAEIEAMVRLDLGSRVTIRTDMARWDSTSELEHTADYHVRSVGWQAAMGGRGASLECDLGLIPVFRA